MEEEWRDIPDWEGYYQVSNLGQVKSFHRKGRMLKQGTSNKGYRRVVLQNKGIKRYISVHRLVMLAFHGPSDLTVNHIDGDKTNNALTNLEYCTVSENVFHAFRSGLKISSKGENHGRSILKEFQVIEIKKLLKEGTLKQKEIGILFGVSPMCIGDIHRGRRWKHIILEDN
jgi:predicted XRE-type DNA-binding protein